MSVRNLKYELYLGNDNPPFPSMIYVQELRLKALNKYSMQKKNSISHLFPSNYFPVVIVLLHFFRELISNEKLARERL